MKYRKKPVVIEAVQWLGDNWDEINDFLPRQSWWLEDGSIVNIVNPKQSIIIKTMEGNMRGEIGDWIIKGVKGEFYPCKPDIFEATYEKADKKMGERVGVGKLIELYKKSTFFKDKDFKWEGIKIDKDGYVYVPQGSFLGQTLINFGDNYEGAGNDALLISEMLKFLAQAIAEEVGG